MNNQWKILTVILIVVVGAGIVFFGLQYISGNQADTRRADEMNGNTDTRSRKVVKLERPDPQSETAEESPPVSAQDSRTTEVFGEIPPGFFSGEKPECQEMEQKIRSFFAYMDKKDAMKESDQENASSAYDTFQKMMADLSENQPIVVGETRDMISLLHNQAHFFRTLDKERIQLIKNILNTEQDILEPAMAIFYAYYGCKDCCTGGEQERISLDALYSYAGFFLDTLSGKSYLMRRSSIIRSLTLYYSVMIVDQANEEGANRFGLDSRPHIDLALDEISNRDNLRYKDRYVDDLQKLEEKYQDGLVSNSDL